MEMTERKKILLVGCGKMGGSLLNGWLTQKAYDQISVVEPTKFDLPDGINLYSEVSALPADYKPSVVVFAVKPQLMDEVVADYARFINENTLFLSIAAGKPISYFAASLFGGAIVRAMPNTPAAVHKGITVLCANDKVSQNQKVFSSQLMESVGDVTWINDETLMDAVTGLSGSGPAYVFHLVEAMASAGEAAGLSSDMAMKLARATVVGSGELLAQSEESAATLREKVTSPGGTTAAALEVLMGSSGMTSLLTKAISKATIRSRELA